MARIRSVKPEIRRSLTVARWPYGVRLAWIYLLMYLDDAGRGLDDMRLISAECFPLDRDIGVRKMEQWIQLMASTTSPDDEEPPLCRYEVQGKRYLHATGWHHQRINRPQPSRIPQCPVHEKSVRYSVNDSVNHSVNGAVSDSHPTRAPADQGAGSREQGTRDNPPTPQRREGDEDHHEHESNARRALEQLVQDRSLPLPVDELLTHAYRLGNGNPWEGYLAVKVVTNFQLDSARNPAAALRARLETPRTAMREGA